MRDMVSTASRRTFGSAGWASRKSTRAHIAAAREPALVNRPAVGVHRERVRKDQRRAPLRRGMVKGNGDDPAERKAADVGAVDT